MNPITIFVTLFLVAFAAGIPIPDEIDVDDKGKEELAPSESEVEPAEVSPPTEDHEEEERLTPSQQGRLARYNGNFFQLYGATNQIEGNLDAIAGNQLQFRGNLIEFLGNEHSLRGLGAYLNEAQKELQADSEKSTGREKELTEEEAKIVGDLRDLVEAAAGKEHEQAQQKAQQFNLETRQYRLEKEKSELKSEQAVSELEQGNLEDDQIKLENKGRQSMERLIQIEMEREALKKGNAAPAPTSSPEA